MLPKCTGSGNCGLMDGLSNAKLTQHIFITRMVGVFIDDDLLRALSLYSGTQYF